MVEFCKCAAIKMPDGEIVTGYRHFHCLEIIQKASGLPSKYSNDGKYYGEILFSEDLY